MSNLPSIQQLTVTPPNWKLRAQPFVPGSAIVVDAIVQDMSSTPTWRIRPGNVLVKRSSSQTYVSANDPNGDRCGPATVNALVQADAAWGGTTIAIVINGGVRVPTQLAATDTTNALVAARLTANPALASLVSVTVAGNLIRIRSLVGGRETAIWIGSTLPAAFGPNGSSAVGTDADYRVLEDFCDVQDAAGSPVAAIGTTSLAAYYAKENLVNLTPEAQVVLSRNGSFFA